MNLKIGMVSAIAAALDRRGLEILQGEFESHQLDVQLVPCRIRVNEGGCIRVACSKNADWYRAFCARHLSSRVRNRALVDTRIKRRDVSRLLERLLSGRHSRSKYAAELIHLAREAAARHTRAVAQMRVA